MPTDHQARADLEAFLHSGSRPIDTATKNRIIRHLLAACPTCYAQLREMEWGEARLERLLRLPSTEPEKHSIENRYNYDQAFAHAEQSLADYFAAESPMEQPAEELLAELSLLAPEEQVRFVQEEERFARAPMVKQLIDLSHASRYDDPEKMLSLAHLAQVIAEACTVAAAGSGPKLADIRTRAWGHYGNSLRVSGRLQEAEEALNVADRYRKAGTGDLALRARWLEQMASLQTFQRRFESAIQLADEAGNIYRELGESHLLASSMVHKAIASLYAGQAENAADILNRAIPLMDHEEDPHLLLAACHNLILCYIDLDQPEQALELYSKSRELYKEFKDTLILLRTAWQEGRLLRDLGHLRAAETALLRARKGFVERGLAYEVAVVSLDLASVHVRLGALENLRQTLAETMPIFRSLRVGRDALAAIIQLQQVADQEHQALALIREITARLEQLSSYKALRP